MNKYQKEQTDSQRKVLHKHPEWFGGDKGGGIFRHISYPFILEKAPHNLYEGLREDAVSYMKENNIRWHPHWGNMKSSQVACFNHLFSFRKDKKIVLQMLNSIQNIVRFCKVLTIPNEVDETYIAFEVVSSNDWLSEGKPSRGSHCTSLDAFIFTEDVNGQRWLIPIEWKYTEAYATCDKTIEGKDNPNKDGGYKGKTRLKRYADFIRNSKLLKSVDCYEGSIYFQEPFYQLMRQTLWAEQIISKSFEEECLAANQMLHLHIIPKDNTIQMLPQKYRKEKESVCNHWLKCLQYPDHYISLSPEELLSPILDKLDNRLIEYLRSRYW